jgi:hypothetical protein
MIGCTKSLHQINEEKNVYHAICDLVFVLFGALGGLTSGDTRAAIYPGLGVEGFWGPFGLRLDGGDEIYFDR